MTNIHLKFDLDAYLLIENHEFYMWIVYNDSCYCSETCPRPHKTRPFWIRSLNSKICLTAYNNTIRRDKRLLFLVPVSVQAPSRYNSNCNGFCKKMLWKLLLLYKTVGKIVAAARKSCCVYCSFSCSVRRRQYKISSGIISYLNILMFHQIFSEVIFATCQYINHTSWKIGCVKNLEYKLSVKYQYHWFDIVLVHIHTMHIFYTCTCISNCNDIAINVMIL